MNKLIKKLLKISGFKKLNPVQEEALKNGLLEGKNLVIASPTASGKSFIFEIAGINTLANERGKVLYIAPLRALCWEKYQDLKRKYEKEFGIKIAISTGDFDSSDLWLARYDWIIVTCEKCDSLIRHGAEWIKDVGLVIVDEIHLIDQIERGPTLEVTITRLKEIIQKTQFLLLSATIKNADELAGWINGKTIVSNYRPVKLYEGVCYNSKIVFLDKEGYKLDEDLPVEDSIVKNTLRFKKQIIFFVGTRKRAEKLAEKLGKTVKKYLTPNEKRDLNFLSEEILNVLEVPTKQCKKLAECVKNGVASHHAGYLSKQRILVEEYFRKGLLKVITATPTLQLGLNLPAWRVVVRDLKRYHPGFGALYIPVIDYKQFVGRAGRPSYDSWGESIIIARNEMEAEDLIEHYILGEPEKITSKLAVEPILRVHTLALIASDFCKSKESLMDFFSKTFYAYQFQDIERIKEKTFEIIKNLKKWKFIVSKKRKIEATRIGKRVSELYIDPLTAYFFIKSLKKVKKIELFGILQLISNTVEMKPLPNVKSKEFDELNEVIAERESCFLQKIPREWDLEFDDFLKSVKMALVFESWINEATEDDILTKFKITPGELRGRLEIADWLLYSLHELALLLRKKSILKDIKKLRVRMHYGVKEELLPLVKLKNVGRVRARKIWLSGIKSIKELRKVPIEKLSKIVGPNIAKNIKDQLKGKKVKERKVLTLKDFSFS